MAMARARRSAARIDYWPGFVDALATLLLVFVFLLSVFILAQFFLGQEVTNRDTVLTRLNAQIAELTELLALETSESRDLNEVIATLQSDLAGAEGERDRLQALLDAEGDAAGAAAGRVAGLEGELADAQEVSQEALAQVELLNQQIAALRRQLAALDEALDASEARNQESQTQISDLGRRLNVALAAARAGAVAIPLRLLRAAAPDPRRPHRHRGGRRPLRAAGLGALRIGERRDQSVLRRPSSTS